MKKSLFFSSTLLFFSARAMADTIDSRAGNFEDRDIQAIREFINTKRQVTVKEKGGSLSISGEVRTEMQINYETRNGVKQRGIGSPLGVPHEVYDVEVNLMIDYRTDRTWASVKLEFDNDAGVFNGTLNKIKLERAYFGVRFLQGDNLVMDAELGRRRINSFVDSKVQGNSFFDGILVRYDQSFEEIGKVYIHAGPYVIDERRNQYGYLGEVGFLDIANTGLYTKYLLVDWDTKDFKDKLLRRRFDFVISQVTLGYKFMPQRLNKLVQLYVAGLYNHAAHKLKISDRKKVAWGGYVGFSIGELKKKGDWAMDANYQVIAAQAVPDFDAAGIGLGNAAGTGFYTTSLSGSGANSRRTAGGDTNFRGYNITFEYMLTNTLILFQSWAQSHSLDNQIGPSRRFKSYEMEFNYAF